ncbi:hypothetical protein IAT38_003018 [Cryptococcus sp. DSM 104549]
MMNGWTHSIQAAASSSSSAFSRTLGSPTSRHVRIPTFPPSRASSWVQPAYQPKAAPSDAVDADCDAWMADSDGQSHPHANDSFDSRYNRRIVNSLFDALQDSLVNPIPSLSPTTSPSRRAGDLGPRLTAKRLASIQLSPPLPRYPLPPPPGSPLPIQRWVNILPSEDFPMEEDERQEALRDLLAHQTFTTFPISQSTSTHAAAQADAGLSFLPPSANPPMSFAAASTAMSQDSGPQPLAQPQNNGMFVPSQQVPLTNAQPPASQVGLQPSLMPLATQPEGAPPASISSLELAEAAIGDGLGIDFGDTPVTKIPSTITPATPTCNNTAIPHITTTTATPVRSFPAKSSIPTITTTVPNPPTAQSHPSADQSPPHPLLDKGKGKDPEYTRLLSPLECDASLRQNAGPSPAGTSSSAASSGGPVTPHEDTQAPSPVVQAWVRESEASPQATFSVPEAQDARMPVAEEVKKEGEFSTPTNPRHPAWAEDDRESTHLEEGASSASGFDGQEEEATVIVGNVDLSPLDNVRSITLVLPDSTVRYLFFRPEAGLDYPVWFEGCSRDWLTYTSVKSFLDEFERLAAQEMGLKGIDGLCLDFKGFGGLTKSHKGIKTFGVAGWQAICLGKLNSNELQVEAWWHKGEPTLQPSHPPSLDSTDVHQATPENSAVGQEVASCDTEAQSVGGPSVDNKILPGLKSIALILPNGFCRELFFAHVSQFDFRPVWFVGELEQYIQGTVEGFIQSVGSQVDEDREFMEGSLEYFLGTCLDVCENGRIEIQVSWDTEKSVANAAPTLSAGSLSTRHRASSSRAPETGAARAARKEREANKNLPKWVVNRKKAQKEKEMREAEEEELARQR